MADRLVDGIIDYSPEKEGKYKIQIYLRPKFQNSDNHEGVEGIAFDIRVYATRQSPRSQQALMDFFWNKEPYEKYEFDTEHSPEELMENFVFEQFGRDNIDAKDLRGLVQFSSYGVSKLEIGKLIYTHFSNKDLPKLI